MSAERLSLVHLRPDGWHEAGTGWTTYSAAAADGKAHNWGPSEWAIVPAEEIVVNENGDRVWMGEMA